MQLDSPLTDLKGVGPELAKKFAILGIKTVGELIDYFPRRYEDYSHVTPTSQLRPGPVTIKAAIKQARGHYVRRGMHITEAVASDEHGSVRLVWFNQPYRAAALKHGQDYYISGDYELRRQRFSILNPSVELVSEFPVSTARIVPVYRETKGLASRQIRQALGQVIEQIRLQRFALFYAKPVLLVDDNELQVLHVNLFLDERLRAYHELYLSFRNRLVRPLFLRRLLAPNQQANFVAIA